MKHGRDIDRFFNFSQCCPTQNECQDGSSKSPFFIIVAITQVIIEILALSLAENGVIFRYNHLRRGDYSWRTHFQNSRFALCQCI